MIQLVTKRVVANHIALIVGYFGNLLLLFTVESGGGAECVDGLTGCSSSLLTVHLRPADLQT